ncbi:inositol 2-dehydrogenase [Caldalkalibacillus thermarum TA2.A1]|uniref:Inositol 2-dehydrogenase n=1 Tax=Caldalkalibacillus thermarum (strain TA2.A1) TaxID=986075 RepID=A0A8X8IB84_CALTT|nr:inositol 2-dehydrogenase [Caldalkalibacillus thermarum]QZT35236.1 inositol 2-dehydrogenase [Caldalkalibacillus thermarum TA2.A1]
MPRIKVGVIGAGKMGRIHIENLCRMFEVDVKSVSDIYADQIKDWARDRGVSYITADYREIIKDPDIDAIFICSSTNTHTQIIAEGAQAGKHIFCEKPFSFDLEETKRALNVVEQAGVKMQVGFNRRFDHNFKRVRDIVQEGKIGDPHIIKITSRDPAPPSLDYIKVSGGLFVDMAIHDFDMARYVSGSEVEEVFVKGGVLVDPAIGEAGDIDTAVITLTFNNGAIGIIDNSRQAVYGYDQRVEVFGSKGCVTTNNDYPNTAQWWTADGVHGDKPLYFFLERYKESYVEEVKAFIDCIIHDKKPAVDGQDGLQAELIAYAAKKSLLESRPVKIEEIAHEKAVKQ